MLDTSTTLPLDAVGRLGKYSIYEELAEGGMARVFIARRDGDQELCVLKQLHHELEEHGTASIRFQREAQFISRLAHVNIARVIEAGFEESKFCISMDFIRGQTLAAIIGAARDRCVRLPPEFCIAVIIEVLAGLRHAHEACDDEGVALEFVHRDLSPQNIMIGYDGIPKVIDFGVAHGRVDGFHTAPGMIIGTLRYMSPEQAQTGEIDGRSDLYTIAAVLFEVLTDRALVPEGQAVDMLEHVLTAEATRVDHIDPHLPRALADIVAKGLEKDRKLRWQSAEEFRGALSKVAVQLPVMRRGNIGALVEKMIPLAQSKIARYFLDDSPTRLELDVPPAEVTVLANDTWPSRPSDDGAETLAPEAPSRESSLVAPVVPTPSDSNASTLEPAESSTQPDGLAPEPPTPAEARPAQPRAMTGMLGRNRRLRRQVVVLRRRIQRLQIAVLMMSVLMAGAAVWIWLLMVQA